ncbi:hypothetical protein PO883_14915 [Massilia sp. DJPM01]|uniref:hypothetical protein n=1 Tax=Massilia sp. DJPM01 TaxID=3024404 RepID=UPI00259D40B7|nr:hypothetical protein [Massilia sp. DJPM01]MDM5178487.1 hypothetical protein [Massilia sp. DJPM01]
MSATSGNPFDTARKAASEINTAQMDMRALNSAIVSLLEKFEYRECDQETIDTLYAFTRLMGSSLEKIKDGHGAIEDLVFAKTSPVCGGEA